MAKLISRIILFTGDTRKMAEFYTDVIGLKVVDGSDPGFVILGGEGCELALHQIPHEYLTEGEPVAPREDSYVKFVFHSDDVESDRERLVAAGVRMREVHRYEGMAFCDGIDPEGNIFQISSRV